MVKSTAEFRAMLGAASVLSNLPDGALDVLLGRSRSLRYPKDATIYRRGDPGDSLMVILAGRVKITNVTHDGREIGLNFLGPGDLNGELAALDGKPRSANAVALEPTDALLVLRRDLIPVLEKHPAALLGIIEILAGKVRAMSAAVEHSGLDVPAKAAAALLRLAGLHGRSVDGGTLIDIRLSQRDIANFAGLSRENMNRQISALRNERLIRTDGSSIVLIDPAGLALKATSAD